MKIEIDGRREYLDPTLAEVQSIIRKDIERIKSWGYELIKHDFSTFDIFGSWGKDLGDYITNAESLHFSIDNKTSAEIVLDFYRLIKDACDGMLILGCNTISHLSAGLVHISRIGDDTSGREWERTRKMGVNTLAFRLCQNKAFYVIDADCVGILNDNIDWKLNSQWLKLVSLSDSALFTSCSKLNEEQKLDISKAYKDCLHEHKLKPIDMFDTLIPCKWSSDSENIDFNW